MSETLKLYLENGSIFEGESVGHQLNDFVSLGELVFNTSMTGYQEIITDPSYCDQILVMTYPLIGNYGVNKDDFESMTPHLKGLILKDSPPGGSNWRNEYSLKEFLTKFKVPCISGLDTRMLTKMIRMEGSMKAVLANPKLSFDKIQTTLHSDFPKNQIEKVSTKQPIHFPGEGKRIILIDFGYKKNILRSLLKRNCDVVVVPFNSSTDLIRGYRPQGIVLSNGPGDPQSVPEVLPVISELQQMYPLFGICMGHQLFALANGAKTEKLKFGHRGSNHPVKDLKINRVFMTSQNHGYSVNKDSIPLSTLKISQINLNDSSVEGLEHAKYPAFSVQYHPEACPGPEDTGWLFDQFLTSVGK